MRSRFSVRIVAPSLVVSLLLLALGGFSGWYVHQQQEQAAQVLGDSVVRIQNAEEIASACRETRFNLGQFATSGDQRFVGEVRSNLGALPARLARGKELAKSDKERGLLHRIQIGQMQVQGDLASLSAGSEATHRSQASRLADDAVTDLMVGPSAEYLEASAAWIDRNSKRAQEMARRVALGFLLLGVCGAVAGLVAGYAIARGMRHTLFRLHVPIRTATGKLEEVIGPIDIAEPRNLCDLDSTLERLADRVATVVDRLQESQLELLRAEQLAALGQMAAGLAHELRNPLTSIKILVQTAAEAGDDAKLDGPDVAVLAEELTRLEDSIQRFLDFARPPTIEKRLFDVRDVIQRIFDLVAARAAQQQVRLQKNVPETPVEIWADREQVRQLLLNTVLNAMDAVGHGGSVELSLRAVDPPGETGQNGRWADIVVHDTGPGIPAALADRIFEPFVSTKDTGLGLGLAICRRIAEAHRGEILARNASNGGAEFAIRLPLSTPATRIEK